MESLCKKLLVAKQAEAEAKAHRLEIEKEIISVISLPPEGTRNFFPPGYQLTVTTKYRRKLDYTAYLKSNVSETQTFVELKPSINLKWLRLTEKRNPDLVANCVTTYPAKPAIKIVEVKK